MSERRADGDAPAGAAILPSEGLLSFYDRLRRRVEAAAARRGDAAGAVARYLLLAPDVFVLLARLALDREVPAASRALVGGALAYFLLPADLLPELVLGAGGFVEDVVLACAVLAHAFGGELEPFARRHWSGGEPLRELLRDVTTGAEALLGGRLYGRLRRLLERRGVRLPA